MKLTDRRSIVYVTSAAAFVALLVIARPVINPTTVPVQQSPGSVATTPPPVVPVVDLDLARLGAASGQLRESERDPFRFRPKAPPPPPRVQAPPQIFVPPPPPGPPPVPPIPLKYFGTYSMTVNGQRVQVAAFSDARGNTFTGKVGDILEGRYRLLRIGQDSVDLVYLDGRGQQSIRMTGQ